MGFVRQITGTTRKAAAQQLVPTTQAAIPSDGEEDQDVQAPDVEQDERRRRARLFAGIRTSPLGITGGLGEAGRSRLLGL